MLSKEFDRTLGRGRSFSFANLENQSCNAKEYKRVSKKLTVCNHQHHLPSQGSANRLPYIAAPRAFFKAGLFYQKRRSVSIFAAWMGGFSISFCRGPCHNPACSWADTCRTRPQHRCTAERPSPRPHHDTWAGCTPYPVRGCTCRSPPATRQRR